MTHKKNTGLPAEPNSHSIRCSTAAYDAVVTSVLQMPQLGQPSTRQLLSRIFHSLDYPALASIYCDEGGNAFWKDRKGPCQKLGLRIAKALSQHLNPTGQSLYVGAGVAEIPMLLVETRDLNRTVHAFNLREIEVTILNQACKGLPFSFTAGDVRFDDGAFNHLGIVSVLNDPECYPETSALSYGRANPVTFDTEKFLQEKKQIQSLIGSCLEKLTLPGLVTTSVEEVSWIIYWCDRHQVGYEIVDKTLPTAIVGDPICFIRLSPIA